jgi:carboxylesterase
MMIIIKREDFQYMHRGQVVGLLEKSDEDIVKPITLSNQKHERAALLLHGFSSSPAVYRRMIPALIHYDHIICPVLPGHGESIDAFATTTAKQWMQTAQSACEELVSTYSEVDVIGLSLGGILACHLSTQFRLHHLFLLAPAFTIHLPATLTRIAVQALKALGIRRIPNRAGNIHTPGHAELAYRQLPLTTILEILNLIQQFKWQTPTCPVDVFLGRFDEVVNNKAVAARFADLPNAQLHWLEQSAHVLPLDGDLQEIIHCINKTFV